MFYYLLLNQLTSTCTNCKSYWSTAVAAVQAYKCCSLPCRRATRICHIDLRRLDSIGRRDSSDFASSLSCWHRGLCCLSCLRAAVVVVAVVAALALIGSCLCLSLLRCCCCCCSLLLTDAVAVDLMARSTTMTTYRLIRISMMTMPYFLVRIY